MPEPRITEVASKLTVIVWGKDGKSRTTYEVYPSGMHGGHFADLANTLDHCRTTGLIPEAEKTRAADVASNGRRARAVRAGAGDAGDD